MPRLTKGQTPPDKLTGRVSNRFQVASKQRNQIWLGSLQTTRVTFTDAFGLLEPNDSITIMLKANNELAANCSCLLLYLKVWDLVLWKSVRSGYAPEQLQYLYIYICSLQCLHLEPWILGMSRRKFVTLQKHVKTASTKVLNLSLTIIIIIIIFFTELAQDRRKFRDGQCPSSFRG